VIGELRRAFSRIKRWWRLAPVAGAWPAKDGVAMPSATSAVQKSVGGVVRHCARDSTPPGARPPDQRTPLAKPDGAVRDERRSAEQKRGDRERRRIVAADAVSNSRDQAGGGVGGDEAASDSPATLFIPCETIMRTTLARSAPRAADADLLRALRHGIPTTP
jgi:hypothetical protein